MTNKNNKPTDKEMLKTVGKKSTLWKELKSYIEKYYEFTQEIVFYGEKYGWTLRYRRSRKTLCSLFPEKDAFTVLIVLGKKEVEKTQLMLSKLDKAVKKVFEETKQLRDGRWLWISVRKASDVELIKVLLSVKRRPKIKS
jgi:hypothetical protein